ncbi:glycosyl transferase, group 1 [Rhodobacterales bacterium Y4I]|nr:glycosyl transferase, group 1 [Rhodobacterales bacterium Y4I]
MRPLFYDLTELLYLSHGFKTYYGIAKVVAEGAKEAFRANNGTRFVAYSQGHDAFFEVFPKYDDTAEGGIDLNVPNSGKPYFMRRIHNRKKKKALHYIAPFVFGVVDLIERSRWALSGADNPIVSLDGGAWVSCGRPKLIIHPIKHLQKLDVEIHVLIHDMIPLHDFKRGGAPDFSSSFLGDNQWLLEHADHVIGNSQFTIDDAKDFARQGILPELKRTSVAPLVHELRAGDEEQSVELPERPYFLMVGTMLGRKNLDVVLNAMNLIAKRGETPPLLVLAGKRRHRTMDYLDKEEMALVKPHVLQLDTPNQSDLVRLYEASQGVILPSRIEGWGLPAGEALWAGVPAVCADIPVMREVCGDLGLYFGVDDPETLAGHMQRLTQDPAFSAEWRAKIAANRDRLRTWRDFGQDLLANVAANSEPARAQSLSLRA